MNAMQPLRDYQSGVIQKCRTEFVAGKKRIVLYAPTGAGKSVVAEALVRNAISKGKRVAIIANRIHLIKQLSDRFTAGKIPHGIIQGDNSRSWDQPVLICSIQSITKRGLPDDIDFIIVDEGHACAGSKAYRALIFKYNALPVISLTATPFSRGMGKPYPELGGEPLFQTIVVAATIRELIEAGYLVDCEIYAPSEPDLAGVKLQRNQFGELDYAEKDLAEAVDKPGLIGDIVSHWLRMANGKPTVCFATNIAHSKHIVEQFVAAGVSARHIDCYMEEEEKTALLADFKAGKFVVLSNVALIAEGFDHPACTCMILARPTKSLIRFIQMSGRILRTYEGKTHGVILDHSGSTHQLGYPTDDLPLELCDGTAKTSTGERGEEKEAPKPKKCPSCSFMKPAGVHVCPKCGFAPAKPNTVKTEEGELKLVDRSKKGELARENKQAIYSQLLAIQEASASIPSRKGVGYSDHWVSNQYKQIFGVYPRGMQDIPSEPTVEVKNYIQYQRIRFAKGMAKGASSGVAA